MNLIQEIEQELEHVYHKFVVPPVPPVDMTSSTTTQPETTTMTFRDVLQSKITAVEAEFKSLEAALTKAGSTLAAAKTELATLEAGFSAVLDKDVTEVKAFFEQIAAHFQAPVAPVPVVDPAAPATTA